MRRRMRAFVVLSLVAAALLAAPADATHACASPGTCADAGSVGSGACDAGSQSNSVAFTSTDAPGLYAAAAGGTSCSKSADSDASAIGAGGYASTPAGSALVGADWSSLAYGAFVRCSTIAYAYGNGSGASRDLGCPAGGPAAVPAVLP